MKSAVCLIVAGWVLCGVGSSQTARPGAKTAAPGRTVEVLMLSDLHFDPLRDPGKVQRLVDAPVEGWEAIFAEPASEHQAADFAETQAGCKATAIDSSYALLNSSLKAEKAEAAGVRLVTVSGDLLAHNIDCRYGVAMKGKAKGYAAFAAKATEYVMRRVEAEFTGLPVYFALGNNDSGCGDYRMVEGDEYFSATSAALVAGLRGASGAELGRVKSAYERGGYYSVTAGGGLEKTRLISLNDLFLATKYRTCAGGKEDTAAKAELVWLAAELQAAREKGERVWLMGHMPPGIDIYSTLKNFTSLCTRPAERFLVGDALDNLIAKNADVIKLAVFGHTHEDEFRVVGKVPVKLVGSISPNNGNEPSFTVAAIDRATSVMRDYAVFTASNLTGVEATWSREYRFSETYHEPSFTVESLEKIVGRFHADPGAATAESTAYQESFFPSKTGSPLGLAWPQYVCSLDHMGESDFKGCVCATQAAPE